MISERSTSQKLSGIVKKLKNSYPPKRSLFHFSGMESSCLMSSASFASDIAVFTEYSHDTIFGTSMRTLSPGSLTSLWSFFR